MAVSPHKGKAVLVVEDDFETREMMALALEKEGYSVSTVANGQEALDHLRKSPLPCLILLDLMMPVMDGWEFREKQAQSPALALIPVVIISGAGNIREKAQTLGVADYLEKPIELDCLLNIVQRYC
jgi:CheY-like chemotaxis protein